MPTCKFKSTGTHQEPSTIFNVPSDSAAMFATDRTSNYGGTHGKHIEYEVTNRVHPAKGERLGGDSRRMQGPCLLMDYADS